MSKEEDCRQTLPLQTDEDVVRLRKAVRDHMIAYAFGLTDQTKFITASSELARNTLRYGGGGTACIERIDEMRRGLCLTFHDEGQGIADIELALKEGYTSGGGMGLGLGGAKRLSDGFEIESTPGKGTTVKIWKWKPY